MRTALLLLFVFFTTLIGDAQPLLYSATLQEALLKKSNKIWYIHTLTDSLIIDSTIIVYPNGVIKEANGRQYVMNDGDCIKFKGQLVVLYQWNRDDSGLKVKKRLVRVWSRLSKPLLMQNGIYAMPDGYLKLPSGSYVKLKNNDFVGDNGTIATTATAYK